MYFSCFSCHIVFNMVTVNCRLKAAGIRCPTPILLRLHVLVMEFIGIVCMCVIINIFRWL
jgi:hypothetical protein